uniref:HECT domain-containing protein n=1 Tax=Amphimedon queenslandica TaxID=400682 RepID=A0A1X7VJR7_AMPQE
MWRHHFVCLAYKDQLRIPTADKEKDDLLKAGLGEKFIVFDNLDMGPNSYREKLLQEFARLENGGGFYSISHQESPPEPVFDLTGHDDSSDEELPSFRDFFNSMNNESDGIQREMVNSAIDASLSEDAGIVVKDIQSTTQCHSCLEEVLHQLNNTPGSYEMLSIEANEYYKLGMYTAMSILQGGCGLPFLPEPFYQYLISGQYVGVSEYVESEDLLDMPQLKTIVNKVHGYCVRIEGH